MRTVLVLVVLAIPLAAAEDPDTGKAVRIYRKAYRLLDAGKVDEAIRLFSDALDADPNLYLAQHALGGAYVMKKNYAQAARHYREAIRIKPDFAESHNSLGVVLTTQGKHVDAIAAYQNALAIQPAYTVARVHLAEAQLSGGRKDLAKKTLEEAVRRDAKAHRAVYLLATMAAEAGAGKKALELLDDAIRIKPDFSEAHHGRGQILAATGDLEGAEAAYLEATKNDPRNLRAWFDLGVTATKQKHWKVAVEAFHRAHGLQPESGTIRVNLGIALIGRFEETGARAELEKAVEMLTGALEADANLPRIAEVLRQAKARLAELPAPKDDDGG